MLTSAGVILRPRRRLNEGLLWIRRSRRERNWIRGGGNARHNAAGLGAEALGLLGLAVAHELALDAGGLAFFLVDLLLRRRRDRDGICDCLARNLGQHICHLRGLGRRRW